MNEIRERPRERDTGARVAVWFVWVVCTVLLGGLFAADARNVPLAEDWLIVPAMTGNEADFSEWLWSQNNEHRVPFSRLVMLAILEVTGGNFVVIGWFNLALQAGMAAALMEFARRLRGRADVADAFFPLLLLNWGHSAVFLFPFLNSLVLPIAATVLVGMMLAEPRGLMRARTAIVAGFALVTLPLGGFVGLLFVPGLALGLGAAWWWERRTEPEGARASGIVLVTAIALTCALSAWYFVGYETPWWNPPSPGVRASARTAVRVLAMGFGVAAADAWRPFGVAALGFVAATVGVVAFAIGRASAGERMALAIYGVFLVNAVGFALAVGWARSGWERQFGIPTRYALLAAPAIIACFIAWVRCASSGGWTLWLPRVLAMAMLALLPWNTRGGDLRFADWYRVGMEAFHRDVASGMRIDELAATHQPFLYHAMKPEEMAARMRMLRDASVVPFRDVPRD